ncbi:MAG: hypothetical protein LUG96_04220 [Tannerellaceae bacterium]|nr:hypothetical protein [Tannerellaceae bacterium]
MKKIIIGGFIGLLFASCSSENDPIESGNSSGDFDNTSIKIVLVDETLQDRLSPESSVYMGEVSVNGIEILYPYNGKKLTLLQLWPTLTQGLAEFPEDFQTVRPPYRKTEEYNINEYTFGYYYLAANPYSVLLEGDITYVYIRYADGQEDEIKVQIFKNKADTLLLMRRIWINGELVYEMSENTILFYDGILPDSIDITVDPDAFKDYYNPKYYPWLEPVLDDNGNQIGTNVRPQSGSDAIVIMK